MAVGSCLILPVRVRLSDVMDNVPRPSSDHIPSGELLLAVERMAAYGLTPLDVQRVLAISAPDFEFFYRVPYERGLPYITTRVADVVVRAALKGDTRAGLAFLRARAPGWSDKADVNVHVSPNTLTEDERKSIVNGVLERLKPAADSIKPQFKVPGVKV